MNVEDEQQKKIKTHKAIWFLLILYITIYVLAMTRLASEKYDRFNCMGYDLSIFTQATWLISQGKSPFVTIRGVHILGDHFSLVLYLLAPIFRIFPHPKTLLLLQTLALGTGALPVFFLARRRLHSSIAALLFALLFLCYPATQWINLAEFHPDTFAVPALLTALLCIEKKSWRLYAVMLILALMTKETIGLVLIVFGTSLLPQNRKVGFATMVAGAAGLFIANLVIRACNGGHPTPYLWIYHIFGTSLPEIVKNLIFNPALAWNVLNTEANQNVALQLFLPLALLPLLQPLRLLPAIPAMLFIALSSREWMHHIDQWSLCPAIPYLFDATISAYKQLKDGLAEQKFKIPAKLLPVSLVMMAGIGLTQDPIIHFQSSRFFKPETQAAFDRAVAKIPLGASVSAHSYFLPHLAGRSKVYCFAYPFYRAGWGGSLLTLQQHDGMNLPEMSDSELIDSINNADPEYLLIGYANSTIMPPQSYLRLLHNLIKSTKYSLLDITSDYMLFHSGENSDVNQLKVQKFTGKPLKTEAERQKALSDWISQSRSDIL